MIYLVSNRAEIERRRKARPDALIEIWPDLHAGDLFWLGDDERRRAAYMAAERERPTGGLYWIGETSKAALDEAGGPLAWEIAIDESMIPVYYGPWLRDADSLPPEDSLRARALSARSIAVAWTTYDRAGQRIDHRPPSPLDPRFYLRRPKGRTLHLFHGFRTKMEAVAAMADRTPHDPDACAWAQSIPARDFTDLMQRLPDLFDRRQNSKPIL
jgi:hypothetical protein